MARIEISGFQLADLSATRATLRWRTSVPADARWEVEPVLDYGALERGDRGPIVQGPELAFRGFRASQSDPRPKTEHEITIEGLSPGVGYYLRVRAAAGDGTDASRQLLFTTSVPAPLPLPSGAPLKDFLLARARELDAAHKAERAAIRSLDDLRAYQRKIRTRFVERLGGLPERTPLEARTVGVIDRGGYTIENVVIQSFPGFYVPGNLYVPKGLSQPAPCVLGVCGHSVAAKSERQLVQMANVNLARKGFVTLQIDAPGQNEMGWDGSPWTFMDMHYNACGCAHHLEALKAILVLASYGRFVGCPLATWIQGDRESSVVVPGALAHFDLPDLVSVLAPRPVLLSRLVDGSARVLPAGDVEQEYRRARRRYEEQRAGHRLSISDHDTLDGWRGLGG